MEIPKSTLKRAGTQQKIFSFHALNEKYKNRTLNLVLSRFFFILTDLASFLLALTRKFLLSVISFGMAMLPENEKINIEKASVNIIYFVFQDTKNKKK